MAGKCREMVFIFSPPSRAAMRWYRTSLSSTYASAPSIRNNKQRCQPPAPAVVTILKHNSKIRIMIRVDCIKCSNGPFWIFPLLQRCVNTACFIYELLLVVGRMRTVLLVMILFLHSFVPGDYVLHMFCFGGLLLDQIILYYRLNSGCLLIGQSCIARSSVHLLIFH